MINRLWVTLLYYFGGHSHQSCLIGWQTVSKWYLMYLAGSLINHVPSYGQLKQPVSTLLHFLARQFSSIMSHPITNREWVTLLYFCLALAISSIMSYPIICREWVTLFYSFPASLINRAHPMTNSLWVTLLYFSSCHSHQSWLIPWPTECEWHSFISFPGTQTMNNSKCVTLLYLFSRQSHW